MKLMDTILLSIYSNLKIFQNGPLLIIVSGNNFKVTPSLVYPVGATNDFADFSNADILTHSHLA